MYASLARSILTLAIAPVPAWAAPVKWHEPVDIAIGAATAGPWRQNESEYEYVDDPTVALKADGDALVAWVDQAKKDVFLTRVPASASAPSKAVNVSRTPATFSWLPRIALHPDDARFVFLLWQEIIFSGGSHGGDILYARSSDGGVSFSEPLNLSRSRGGDGKGRINRDTWDNGSLDIAADDKGRVFAVWTEYDGPLWFARSAGGERFSAPAQLAGRAGEDPARGPSIAVSADGKVYVAWTVGDNESADIHLAVSDDGGASFEKARRIERSASYSDAPSVEVDANGIVHLAFLETAGSPLNPGHIRYLRSEDAGRTFAAPRVVSAPLPAGALAASAPALELDEHGDVYLLFELHASSRGSARGLALAVATNRGREFSPAQLVPSSRDPNGAANGSRQGSLMSKLAANAEGEIAVVNSSFKAHARSRVWLMRGTRQR